mmetsp:Transcript_42158/g.40395  ORF Transcript_42158/g.40395 Transcript_42158/m.40395 type:complete len:110 (+) Transcript_42158:17-346(+)
MNTALVEKPPPRCEFLKRPHPLTLEDTKRKSPEDLKYYFPEVSPEEVQRQMEARHVAYYHPSNKEVAKNKLYKYLLDTTYKEKRIYEKLSQSIIKFEPTDQDDSPKPPK